MIIVINDEILYLILTPENMTIYKIINDANFKLLVAKINAFMFDLKIYIHNLIKQRCGTIKKSKKKIGNYT